MVLREWYPICVCEWYPVNLDSVPLAWPKSWYGGGGGVAGGKPISGSSKQVVKLEWRKVTLISGKYFKGHTGRTQGSRCPASQEVLRGLGALLHRRYSGV